MVTHGDITLPKPESIFAEGTQLGDDFAELQHVAKVNKEAAASTNQRDGKPDNGARAAIPHRVH